MSNLVRDNVERTCCDSPDCPTWGDEFLVSENLIKDRAHAIRVLDSLYQETRPGYRKAALDIAIELLHITDDEEVEAIIAYLNRLGVSV